MANSLNRETTVNVLVAMLDMYGLKGNAKKHIEQAIKDVKAMDRLNKLPMIKNMLETELQEG